MNKDELRREFTRLANLDTIDDAKDMLNIYSNFLLNTIMKQRAIPPADPQNLDARTILQMMLSKTLYINKMLDGISFASSDGHSLRNIIDPTVIAVIVRHTYETASLFYLIFRLNNSGDERNIVYRLWAHSGLKYRQNFKNIITDPAILSKSQKELQVMQNFIEEIELTALYKNLPVMEQEKIQYCIKKKEYLVHFENNKVVKNNWSDLYKILSINEHTYQHFYAHFSFSTHPSNVSVFQFNSMFDPQTNEYIDATLFNVKFFCMSISFFIADYLILFPEMKGVFENLPVNEQIAINFFNTMMRGYDFAINDSFKYLD